MGPWMKCKAIPILSWTDPEVSRNLRLSDFKTIGTWKWKGSQLFASSSFTHRKYSWYSFLLDTELNPGPLCGRAAYVNEIEAATFRLLAQRLNQLRHWGSGNGFSWLFTNAKFWFVSRWGNWINVIWGVVLRNNCAAATSSTFSFGATAWLI
jgi:hypothetical protein